MPISDLLADFRAFGGSVSRRGNLLWAWAPKAVVDSFGRQLEVEKVNLSTMELDLGYPAHLPEGWKCLPLLLQASTRDERD